MSKVASPAHRSPTPIPDLRSLRHHLQPRPAGDRQGAVVAVENFALGVDANQIADLRGEFFELQRLERLERAPQW